MSSNTRREAIYLTPQHAKVWCVSPGVILFADHVVIDNDDYRRIEAPTSSFDETARSNLEIILDGSDFRVHTEDLSLFAPNGKSRLIAAEKELRVIVDELMTARSPGIITAVHFREALLRAYQVFVSYNTFKTQFLKPDENFARDLEEAKFPEWQRCISATRMAKARDLRGLLTSREGTWSDLWDVSVNLIAVSRSIMDMSEEGYHVYDPLHKEFAPWIELLTRKDILTSEMDEPVSLDTVNDLLVGQLTRLLPNEVKSMSLSEMIRERKRLKALRSLLTDERFIWDDAPNMGAAALEHKLKRVKAAMGRFADKSPWALWALGEFISYPSVAR